MTSLARSRVVEFTRRPNLRSLWGVAADYGWIALAIVTVVHWPHPLLYVASVVVIGTRQHSLLILLHEGVHRQLTAPKLLNDWVSEVVLAWPFLLDFESYRRYHLAHHKHLSSDRDPERLLKSEWTAEWEFPRSRYALARLLLGDLVGLHAASFIAYQRRMQRLTGPDPRFAHRFARAATLLAIASLLAWTGTWIHALLFWAVPASTTLVCFARLREICEHVGVAETGVLPAARTTPASPFMRFLVAPRNVSFHLEHHLFPNVPWFQLRRLHAALTETSEYQRHAHLTHGGFRGAIREITF